MEETNKPLSSAQLSTSSNTKPTHKASPVVEYTNNGPIEEKIVYGKMPED